MTKYAVIVDVDGTLCDVHTALHHITTPGQTKNFDAFHAEAMRCPPTEWVLDWCEAQRREGHNLVVVTGRKYRWERETIAWLDRHLVDHYGPFMRGDDDNRRDTEVKRDIYDQLVNDHGFEIVAAIDDRPSVIALWDSLGIPTTVVHRQDWEDAGEHYSPDMINR